MSSADHAIETLETIRKMKIDGQYEAALDLFEKSEDDFPIISGAYYLKGTLYQDMGDTTSAIKSYKSEIALNPKCVEAHINMGVIYFKSEMYLESIACFKLSILTASDQFLPYYNLAGVMQHLKRVDEAILYYRRAAKINPNSIETWINLSGILKRMGRNDEAIHCYKEILRIKPESKSARHILEAMGGRERTLVRAESEYVENLFDCYAPKFEHSLIEKLRYNVPHTVQELMTTHNIPHEMNIACDLGCGTGLGAEALSHYAKTWIGVDVSSNMLDIARSKGIYQECYKQDIIDFLSQPRHEPYDLITSLDVLPYFGDLDQVICQYSQNLSSRGVVVFTIESDDSIDHFFLSNCGRFKHNPRYILELAESHRLDLIIDHKTILRNNEEVPVEGNIFIFQSSAS